MSCPALDEEYTSSTPATPYSVPINTSYKRYTSTPVKHESKRAETSNYALDKHVESEELVHLATLYVKDATSIRIIAKGTGKVATADESVSVQFDDENEWSTQTITPITDATILQMKASGNLHVVLIQVIS